MIWSEFLASIRHLSQRDQEQIHRAFTFGEEAHESQIRLSGEPFFTHPVAVARIVADLGGDTASIIAALLHDTVEDTFVTLHDIEEKFGKNVAALIDGVTKLTATNVPTIDEAAKEKVGLNDKIESLRKIFTLMQQDVRMMVIKLCDRLHNMQTAQHVSEEKRKALAQETLDVYVKIADRLSMDDIRYDLENLSLSILDPKLHEKLLALHTQNAKRAMTVISLIKEQLDTLHAVFSPVLQLEKQGWDALKHQLEGFGAVATGESDLIIACICPDEDECYRTLGHLHHLWQREILSFEDYINAPMINGYRGLHTTIILDDGTRVRCKIRTREMHDYAHRGIATFCFSGDSVGISEGLPWIKQISAVSEDTAGRSQEFWDSLRNDILGHTIVIHGPGNETAQLPVEATALDGAFYLFDDDALYLDTVRVNGKIVSPEKLLKHADSLSVTLKLEKTVERVWLKRAHTSLAVAIIRLALSQLSNSAKIEEGKKVLQAIFHERKRGFLEEFDEEKLRKILQGLGYSTLDDIYIAIANGRLEPHDVFTAIFATHQSLRLNRKQLCYVKYIIDMDNCDIMDRVNFIHRTYGTLLQNIQYNRSPSTSRCTVTLQLRFSPAEHETLKQTLILAGAMNVEVATRTPWEIFLMCIVIIFWALNPVAAKWFMLNGMSPLTLLTIRLLTFCGLTTLFYIFWKHTSQRHLSEIPRIGLLAIIPAACTFALATFTYLALASMPPSLHLTILRFNVLLLPVAYLIVRQSQLRMLLISLMLLAGSVYTILKIDFGPQHMGIIFSGLSLLSYIFYSIVTESTLQKHKIGVRYPYLLFHLGLLLGIGGLFLMFFQTKESLLTPLTPLAILYVFACVFVPHTAFYAVLKRIQFKNITDPFLLEVPLAAIFELTLLGIIIEPLLYILMFCALAGLLLLRWRKTLQLSL